MLGDAQRHLDVSANVVRYEETRASRLQLLGSLQMSGLIHLLSIVID